MPVPCARVARPVHDGPCEVAVGGVHAETVEVPRSRSGLPALVAAGWVPVVEQALGRRVPAAATTASAGMEKRMVM
ncbi:hypothetical protein [Streptomyces sp. DSM 40907]|uniref:hypothetical protein n=1 Tax=Streptomyces kutzneri TaxID=3051179 RepID=UPI0028D7129D|nr:hypothetical protein [Streptomyces sp. DSM 40907]